MIKKQKTFTFSKFFQKTICKGNMGDSIIAMTELKSKLLKSGYLVTNLKETETITIDCTAAKANISFKERQKRQKEIDRNPIDYSTLKVKLLK